MFTIKIRCQLFEIKISEKNPDVPSLGKEMSWRHWTLITVCDTAAKRVAKSLPSCMDEMQSNMNIADMEKKNTTKQEKEKGAVSHGGEGASFK